MPDPVTLGGGEMVTPYLKGNVAGPCAACGGDGLDESFAPCRRCKGRGILGKSARQIVSETLDEAQSVQPANPEFTNRNEGSQK